MRFPTGPSGQEFEKVSAGTHLAVCNMLVDVGLQPGNPKFEGVIDKKSGKPDSRGLPCPTVYLRFEVPAERITYTKNGVEKEGPQTIYVNLRASMNEKAALRKAVAALHGKVLTDAEAETFDVDSILGKACMITVAHSEDGKYANVKNFMALPKGMPAPKAENPLILYSADNDAAYNSLPQFLQKKIDGQIHAGDNAAAAAKAAALARAASTMTAPEIAQAEREASRQQAMVDDEFGDSVDEIKI